MARVWIKIGHQPSKDEWRSIDYKISYDTYPRHFGSWQNACLKFIEHKMGHQLLTTNIQIEHSLNQNNLLNKRVELKQRDTKTIPLGIRLKILSRDHFCCVFCGRSPATDIGIQLRIDHIVPFSKGGKSLLENLQTLCLECNLGKSNKEL